MTAEGKRVFEAALQLPSHDREQLADALEQSLGEATPQELESAWVEEVKRRVADIDSGKTTPVSSRDTRQMMAEVLERARTRRTG